MSWCCTAGPHPGARSQRVCEGRARCADVGAPPLHRRAPLVLPGGCVLASLVQKLTSARPPSRSAIHLTAPSLIAATCGSCQPAFGAQLLYQHHVKPARAARKQTGRLLQGLLISYSPALQTASKLYLVLDFVNGGHLFFNLYRVSAWQWPRLPDREALCMLQCVL